MSSGLLGLLNGIGNKSFEVKQIEYILNKKNINFLTCNNIICFSCYCTSFVLSNISIKIICKEESISAESVDDNNQEYKDEFYTLNELLEFIEMFFHKINNKIVK